MKQRPAHVQVITVAVQGPPDCNIDQQPTYCHRQRETGVEWVRRPEAIDRLKHDPAQQREIGECVDEGSQRLYPLIAEREPGVWRPARNPLRPPGKPQRERVSEHVQAIRGKRQRAAREADNDFERTEAQNNQAGNTQSARRYRATAMPGVSVIMAMRVVIIEAGHIIRIMH